MVQIFKKLALLWFVVLLGAGCSEQVSDSVAQPAVSINAEDECHLCGMLIQNFSGPKGEVFQQGNRKVKKFCSTRDMFSYALDPEHQASLESMWVHDMGKTKWDAPQDDAFIDARSAWYVINSHKRGAMGPALASFSTQQDATDFIKIFGGDIIRFEQLTLEIISSMTSGGQSGTGGHHH